MLAALCSILHVTPADLITVIESHVQVSKPTATDETTAAATAPPARRVRLTRPGRAMTAPASIPDTWRELVR
ncbi:hypothetical protein [Streptomyces sp. NRRL F-5727]|uniref:hypothetical protein n=1 Tax=Streptomyces sp. NRRL F-5727 TaxID=1463871 RepID=UPI000A8A4F90